MPKSPKSILFVGIRGSGKSTIIKQIKNQQKFSQIFFDSYSNQLKKIMEKENLTSSKFDSFSEERKIILRNQVIANLKQLRENQIVVIEGHLSMYNSQIREFERLFNKQDLLFFEMIVYLKIPTEIIYERRMRDPAKKREVDLDIIRKEIDFEEKYLEILSNLRKVETLTSLNEFEDILINIS